MSWRVLVGWYAGGAGAGWTTGRRLDNLPHKRAQMRLHVVAAACLAALCGGWASAQPTTSTGTGEDRLLQARQALTGPHKNEEKAEELLLGLVNSRQSDLSPASASYALVYLGYIADRAGQRKEAISWYQRALAVPNGDPGILQVATAGLQKPLVWLRHLDQELPPAALSAARPGAPLRESVKDLIVGNGYVTRSDPPSGLTVAKTLSADERKENFEILWEAIDKTYAAFQLKSIDWAGVRTRYEKRLESVQTAEDFYILLFQLVGELRDTHSWLQNYHVALLPGSPGLSVDLFDGKPFVVAVAPGLAAAGGNVRVGSEILAVDGLAIAEKIERLRPYLRGLSSERAFQREAVRNLLAGERGSTVTVKLRSPEGDTGTVSLKRDSGTGYRPPARSLPFPLTKQRFVHFGRLPSGLGYIWIESFNGRLEIADEFDHALETLRDTAGLILDIRDNPGGFGTAQPRIVGRLLKRRALVDIGYTKNGPRHGDLEKRETYYEPGGDWQYAHPVALLVNDVTGSASDLFTCALRSAQRITTVGSTTHGNLSGDGAYVVLPCGLVVRISNGYICDARNRPIEVNGNEPDIAVSPSIADFLAGKDPVLEKAAALLGKAAKTAPEAGTK
jgi:carboxyl-terminal processing protease